MTSPDIQAGYVRELVPLLKNPLAFDYMHDIIQRQNPVLHMTHLVIEAGIRESTNYGSSIVEAISTGTEAYEILRGSEPEGLVLGRHALEVLGSSNPGLDLGLQIAKQLEDNRRTLVDEQPDIALGVLEICDEHVRDKDTSYVYSLGGAAMMHVAYQEVIEQWKAS